MPRLSSASSFVAAAVAALVLGRSAHAAPGDLDGMFGTGGIYQSDVFTNFPGDFDRGLALDDEHRPVLASGHGDGNYDGIFDVAIMRLTTEGALDPTFNPHGATPGLLITGFGNPSCQDGTTHGPVFQSVTTTPDHHIVVLATLCEDVSGSSAIGLMRLDETGAFDNGFNGNGRLVIGNSAVLPEDVAVDSSSRIYVAGTHCAGGGIGGCDNHNAFITRITKEGVRDTTFNATSATPGIFELVLPNVTSHFNAIRVLTGDHIVAAGQYFFSGSFDSVIVRLAGDGTLESTFDPSHIPSGIVVTDLAKAPSPGSISVAEIWDVATTDSDQSVLVTGQNTAAGGATCPLAKFTSTGALDTDFAKNATVPGITTLPGAVHCSHISVQADGKIVLFGWGARPLGPGLSDTNQIVIGRFNTDGTPDASFGTGGTVKTALGDYAIAEDGDIQPDGKLLVAGMTRIANTATINPYVARYLVTAGPTPTATGGSQNPTPTPTATPVDHPGEICDNCIDDEHDGYVDRDDPECHARANGHGQGLGDPKGEGKALVKCEKAIEAAGAKFGAATLDHLQHCTQAVFACVQVKPADAKCLPKAAAACTKQLDAGDKDRSKLADTITKACAAPDVDLTDLTGETGLGFGADASTCATAGVPTLASLADVVACVRARHECAAEHLLSFEVPRASELLVAGGATPGTCLPAAGAPSGGIGDTDRAKAAVKCQTTIQKATTKFAGSEEKAVLGCVQAATSCVQLKPGDADCLTKLHATCTKDLGEIGGPGGPDAKLAAAIAKDCDGLDASDLTGASGLGYQARDAECTALLAPPLGSAAAVADCLRRENECRVGQLLDATTPRAHELLGLGGVALP